MAKPIRIESAEALSSFRESNSAAHVLTYLKQDKHVLINWSVGVGKSHNMDSVIEQALQHEYDCVIVLLPTRALIDERKLIRTPESGLKVVNIEPRPQSLCGQYNAQWTIFEKNGLSSIAKKQLCSKCDHNHNCSWLKQYSKDALAGTEVVFATQAHLKNNPNFIKYIAKKTNSHKPLVIFDEATISLTSYTKSISQQEIQTFIAAIHEAKVVKEEVQSLRSWLKTLVRSTTTDLQDKSAWSCPIVKSSVLMAILEAGVKIAPASFRNIYPQIKEFCSSHIESRQIGFDHNVCFSSAPVLQDFKALLYSATVAPTVLNHRLGVDFVSPYQDYRFLGDGTRWFNIASSTGTNTNFGGNRKQILFLFAQLTLKRIQEGKRVLLISKKSRIEMCIEDMNLLVQQVSPHLRVVNGNDYTGDINQIPIIHYGVIGINKFEQFDCAFCLNSFYITPEILSKSIQDTRAEDDHIELSISVSGQPRRRIASVKAKYLYTDVAALATPMLKALEMGTVIQTVGRVRPFTQCREVITYQNDVIDGLTYTAEFNNLAGAREFFGLETHLEQRLQTTYKNVQDLKNQGMKQKEIAAALGISVRTVRRHYK